MCVLSHNIQQRKSTSIPSQPLIQVSSNANKPRIQLEQIHSCHPELLSFLKCQKAPAPAPATSVTSPNSLCPADLLQAGTANIPLQQALSTQIKALLCVTHLWLTQLTAESLHTRKLSFVGITPWIYAVIFRTGSQTSLTYQEDTILFPCFLCQLHPRQTNEHDII